MKKEVLRLFKSYLGEKSEFLWEDGLKYGLLIPNTAVSRRKNFFLKKDVSDQDIQDIQEK